MSNQDPVTLAAEKRVCFSIYPEGLRVRCSISFDCVRGRFAAAEDGDLCRLIVDNMHIVEKAAMQAWRRTPLGESVLVKDVDF